MRTAEQIAREILDRMDVDDALLFTAGDVVELANLVAEVIALRRAVSVPGPKPSHHMAVQAQSRKEWPTLWLAIDKLVARAEGWERAPEVEG